MSDTPRTDRETMQDGYGPEVVHADLARQLERELAKQIDCNSYLGETCNQLETQLAEATAPLARQLDEVNNLNELLSLRLIGLEARLADLKRDVARAVWVKNSKGEWDVCSTGLEQRLKAINIEPKVEQ